MDQRENGHLDVFAIFAEIHAHFSIINHIISKYKNRSDFSFMKT
jgi:hypothetical protein